MREILLTLFLGFSLIFTACNRSPVQYETPRETVNSDLEELDASDITFSGSDDQDSVTGDFTLPVTSESGNPVTWTSSDPDHVSITDGDAGVTRPGYFEGDVTVTLTGTVTIGDTSGSSEIVVQVAAVPTHSETLWNASYPGVDDYEAYDSYGYSVSISGDYAIVGAYAEDGAVTDGNRGAAYILERDVNGSWDQVVKLQASDTQDRDIFGYSVSISGSYAIVGANQEDYLSADINFNCGAAYIFERDGSGYWIEREILHASDAAATDYFGNSVAISGSYAIVGAEYEDADGFTNAGSAYIFERDTNGNWNQFPVSNGLWASNKQNSDFFGHSVSISGNYAVVGAHYGDSKSAADSGTAYIFERDSSGNWSEKQILEAPDGEANDQFGLSVSISGDYVIVGAPFNVSASTPRGAAYIFERETGGSWNFVKKLTAINAYTNDEFGYSVSLNRNFAVVGARREDEVDPNNTNNGAVYIFKRDNSGNWYEDKMIRALTTGDGDFYGHSVSLSEDTVIVGAHLEDGPGDTVTDTGAVYILY